MELKIHDLNFYDQTKTRCNEMKRSRKLMIMLLFILISSPIFAQSVFDQFNGKDGVASIVVNEKMFELMSKVKVDTSDKETQQYLNLIKKLDDLKVFTTQNERIEGEMKNAVGKYIKTTGLEELMHIKDKGRNIKIMIKPTTKDIQIKELLMFIEGGKDEDTVLMSLTGDFDLNEISVLIDKMKIPGGEELKKATQDKK